MYSGVHAIFFRIASDSPQYSIRSDLPFKLSFNSNDTLVACSILYGTDLACHYSLAIVVLPTSGDLGPPARPGSSSSRTRGYVAILKVLRPYKPFQSLENPLQGLVSKFL